MLRFRTRTRKAPGGGGGGAPAASMLVGMNISQPYYGVGPTPFADLMLNPDYWQDTSAAYVFWATQDQGLITGNTVPHELVAVIATPTEQLPAGTYTVRNPGGASIQFGILGKDLATSVSAAGAYTTATSLTFTLSANSDLRIWCNGNLSQKITILLPGHVTSYDGGDPFNSAWKTFHANTQVFRTMDWTGTNTSLEEVWADRSVTTKCWYRNFMTGFPIESAIDIANAFNKPFWLSIPCRATDAWVTSCANLVLSRLSAGLSVYLEYVNEIWNGGNVTFAANTEWVRHLNHTRLLATVSGTTLTRTAHGWSNGQKLKGFPHKGNVGAALANQNLGASPNINDYYPAINGGDIYVKVLTANTFELWDTVALTGTRMSFPAAFTQIWLIDPAEVGKLVDVDVNYATRAKQIWDIFDGVLGSSRVKAVMGTQSSVLGHTTGRFAVTAAGLRADYVAPAPYFIGVTMGAAIDRTSGTFTPKFWSSESAGSCTVRMRVYASGSTPRKDQIKDGTGTGLVSGGAPASWTQSYNDTSSAYVSGTAVTGLSNGTSYLVWFCVTDASGYDWFWSQTVAAAAVTDTVDVLDTYANQSLRAMLDITGACLGASDTYTTLVNHKTSAQAVNSSCRVFCYEGQNHQDNSRPASITTWWNGWLRDSTYADILTRYLNTASAADAAGFEIYQDIQASGPWGTADSSYDVTDARHVAINALGGFATKRSIVSIGATDGGSITADPGSYPYTFYTFSDSSLTYSIINGDNEENFSISGANVRLAATTGINWSSSTSHPLKIRATDGYTDSIFTLTVVTGDAWYSTSNKSAWSAIDDTTPAAMNLVTGNPLALTGTAATVVSDGWDLAGVASYLALHGNGTLAFSANPLFLFVGRPDADASGFQNVIRFGSSPNVQWYTSSSTQVVVAGSQFTDFAISGLSNTNAVFWTYFDTTNLKVYFGKNQTVLNVGGTTFTNPGTSFPESVEVGGGSCSWVIGALESAPASNLTAALALVQKAQTKHSIA